MSKHTPGPWKIGSEQTDGLGRYAQVQSSEEFGDIVARVCVAHNANHTLNRSGRANARLIAAAPELLEALELILPYLTDGEDAGDEATALAPIVRAAIAKAKGEAQ